MAKYEQLLQVLISPLTFNLVAGANFDERYKYREPLYFTCYECIGTHYY